VRVRTIRRRIDDGSIPAVRPRRRFASPRTTSSFFRGLGGLDSRSQWAPSRRNRQAGDSGSLQRAGLPLPPSRESHPDHPSKWACKRGTGIKLCQVRRRCGRSSTGWRRWANRLFQFCDSFSRWV